MGAQVGAPLPSYLQWMEGDFLNSRAAHFLFIALFVIFKVYRAWKTIMSLEKVEKGDAAYDASDGDIGAVFICPQEPTEEERKFAIPRRRVREVEVTSRGVEGCASACPEDGSSSWRPEKSVMFQGAAAYTEVRHEYMEYAPTLDVDNATGFGEHIFVNSLGPDDVCIGDTWRVKGDWRGIEMRVSCPAIPGRDLDEQHNSRLRGRGGVRDYTLRKGTAGWHCSIVKPGKLRIGDVLICTKRPNPDWTVRKVAKAIYGNANDEGKAMPPAKEFADEAIPKLQALQELSDLPWQDWREVATELLKATVGADGKALEPSAEGKKES
mmetsp:Transcript_52055/g.123946  ORF Transcript_52055/g.123946 Transcript_52055/m.123946 type:complete len:324 (+) Transcript_52055:83-1054(+)